MALILAKGQSSRTINHAFSQWSKHAFNELSSECLHPSSVTYNTIIFTDIVYLVRAGVEWRSTCWSCGKPTPSL